MASFDRPEQAYIVSLINGNKMALTKDASGNVVVMYGKYDGPDNNKFRVMQIKHYSYKVPVISQDDVMRDANLGEGFESKAYVAKICNVIGKELNKKKKIPV
jgi:hypothetical protein